MGKITRQDPDLDTRQDSPSDQGDYGDKLE